MSRREIDSRGEKAMGVFLDKYFYPKTLETRLISYYERIYEKKLQLQGVDIILDKRRIDEKPQLYYINRPVGSFAFEIEYYSEKCGHNVDGWFINNQNLTDDYLLLWIDKARIDKVNRLVAEDFEYVHADLISKDRLKAYLTRLGISDKELKQKAVEMREKSILRIDLNEDIHLSYSVDGYSEKPINLVIDKKILDNISSKRYEIKKDGIRLLDNL